MPCGVYGVGFGIIWRNFCVTCDGDFRAILYCYYYTPIVIEVGNTIGVAKAGEVQEFNVISTTYYY